MRTREWAHVVRAAQHTGCKVARASDTHVYLVRGAIRIFAVRKFPVSVQVQRLPIRAMELSQDEWTERCGRLSARSASA